MQADKRAPALAQVEPGSPSPLRGGVRGGANPDVEALGVPPSLSLPYEGGGDDAARGALHGEVCP